VTDPTAEELERALNVVLEFVWRRRLPKLPGLIAEALLQAAAADLAAQGTEDPDGRRAPVQATDSVYGNSLHPSDRKRMLAAGRKGLVDGTIAWSEHKEAWQEYARAGHGSQSAERLAERGGFGYSELLDLLGREPRTWRPR
jgi:hypothetical protein